MQIYKPLDDSYFFSSFLEKYLARQKKKNLAYLDMGTGSGILSEVASKYLDSVINLVNSSNKREVI